MYTCHFARAIEEPWTTLDPIFVGVVPPGCGTPERYCLVKESGYPVMRIDVYGQEMAFAEAQIWQTWVVIKSVENDLVCGEGAWDPPGRWRPFTISLRSGRIIAER